MTYPIRWNYNVKADTSYYWSILSEKFEPVYDKVGAKIPLSPPLKPIATGYGGSRRANARSNTPYMGSKGLNGGIKGLYAGSKGLTYP